jgi:FkbM family methyltransferase
MNIKRKIKWLLYGFCPGFVGNYFYLGCRVYYPKGAQCIHAAIDQDVFEAENVHLLTALARSRTYCLDIGANIGLVAVPLLKSNPTIRLVSFEASPNVLPYLARTISGSPYGDRWELVSKAVGAKVGKVQFNLSASANSPFDGIKDTQRMPSVKQVEVELTTIDDWWERAGLPEVSVIKCDVEGGELDVLRGAYKCLRHNKPHIMVEWFGENLKAYNCQPKALLDFAVESGYGVFALPNLIRVNTESELNLLMIKSVNFLLSPIKAD